MKLETAGCGRKLPKKELDRALAEIPQLRHLGEDAAPISDTEDLILSIDTSRLIGADIQTFGELAVKHALGDIHSQRAVGISCALSIGLSGTPNDEIRKLMVGVQVACTEEEMDVAKGHTSTDEREIVVTCAIVGRYIAKTAATPLEAEIFLTKPLGASRLLKLATVKDDAKSVSRALYYMRASHRLFVEALEHIPVVMSDVSGFGLAGCLYSLATRNDLHFKLTDPPKRIDEAYQSVNVMCEYDRNQIDFSECVSGDHEDWTLSLYGQEFCGPLVVLAPYSFSSEVIEAAGMCGIELTKIGTSTHRKGIEKPIEILDRK